MYMFPAQADNMSCKIWSGYFSHFSHSPLRNCCVFCDRARTRRQFCNIDFYLLREQCSKRTVAGTSICCHVVGFSTIGLLVLVRGFWMHTAGYNQNWSTITKWDIGLIYVPSHVWKQWMECHNDKTLLMLGVLFTVIVGLNVQQLSCFGKHAPLPFNINFTWFTMEYKIFHVFESSLMEFTADPALRVKVLLIIEYILFSSCWLKSFVLWQKVFLTQIGLFWNDYHFCLPPCLHWYISQRNAVP